MKKFMIFSGLLFACKVSAFAASPLNDQPAPQLANHYACSFARGAIPYNNFDVVVADTTSFAGTPQLHLADHSGRVSQDLGGVKVSETFFGLEISGFNQGLADAFESYTIFVPKVVHYTRAAVTVPGMMVRSFSSAMPMPFGPVVQQNRPLQQNTFVPVNCLAAFIQP